MAVSHALRRTRYFLRTAAPTARPANPPLTSSGQPISPTRSSAPILTLCKDPILCPADFDPASAAGARCLPDSVAFAHGSKLVPEGRRAMWLPGLPVAMFATNRPRSSTVGSCLCDNPACSPALTQCAGAGPQRQLQRLAGRAEQWVCRALERDIPALVRRQIRLVVRTIQVCRWCARLALLRL